MLQQLNTKDRVDLFFPFLVLASRFLELQATPLTEGGLNDGTAKEATAARPSQKILCPQLEVLFNH